jgi:hypothetical protein
MFQVGLSSSGLHPKQSTFIIHHPISSSKSFNVSAPTTDWGAHRRPQHTIFAEFSLIAMRLRLSYKVLSECKCELLHISTQE